jgi:hypothetical protein
VLLILFTKILFDPPLILLVNWRTSPKMEINQKKYTRIILLFKREEMRTSASHFAVLGFFPSLSKK